MLESEVAAEVLQVNSGWFEIRLLNGRTGWVWSPLVVLGALVGGDEEPSEQDWAQGWNTEKVVLFKSGRSIRTVSAINRGEVLELFLSSGGILVCDYSLISRVFPADQEEQVDRSQSVVLKGNITLSVKSYRQEGLTHILELHSGEPLVLDSDLVERPEEEANT